MRALVVLCLLGTLAHAQRAYTPSRLDPVAADFCESCRRLSRATFAGIGTAAVYEQDYPAPDGGSTYWFVLATKRGTFAAALYGVIAGGCGAGHCEYVDRVVPALRTFSYAVNGARLADVGVALEVDRTRDLLETEPRSSAHWKDWLFIACGEIGSGTWACRSRELTCERAAWARSAEPAVQSTCTDPLPRDPP
jgi:hypothetical protein